MGNYRVFLDNFETVALPILDLNTVRITICLQINFLLLRQLNNVISPLQDVLFVDEIGKMELFSKEFKKKVTDIFFGSTKRAFVIGTIPQIHKMPQQHVALFEKLHADKRIMILTVTHGNRNNLPEEIARYLS